MLLRHLLLSCALLASPALAQGTRPSTPAARPQSQAPRLNVDELNAQIARTAPAYGGFFVKDGTLYVFVTSTHPAQRQAAVRELFAVQGKALQDRGLRPEGVVFLAGQFNAAQLLNAKHIAGGISGVQSIDIDETRNRVVVELLFPEMQPRAQVFLEGQDLPPGIVVFQAPPPGQLPEGPALLTPHRAFLAVPARVAQGDTLTLELKVTNLSPEALRLEHGSCAFWLEVLDATTRRVVLPLPGAKVCLLDLHLTTIVAGGTVTVASREWNLRTPAGDLLPPGRYVARAAFGVGLRDNKIIRPPDQVFEITAGTPGVGTARVRDVLRDRADGIIFQAGLAEERGQQVVLVTVPDRRAQTAVLQLLRAQTLPLNRVRFRTTPWLQVPPEAGDGSARLKVERQNGRTAPHFAFELMADLTLWQPQGAWRCQFIAQVVDQRTQDVVGGWPSFDQRKGTFGCADTGAPLGLPWRGFWHGRRSDGSAVPAGRYEVRAGLKVTLHSGRIIWLLAPTQEITIP